MQTLGKLRHERFPPSRQRAAQQQEKQQVRQQERRVWRRRLWWFGRLAVLVPVVWLVATLGFAVGRTAEGLVHCDVVTELAPARVRVVALHCRPGQRVRRGDALVELEPLQDAEREVLQAQLRRSRVRLELVRAGVVLDDVDATRRRDDYELARREVLRAEGELERLAGELVLRQRQREQLAAAAAQAALARCAEVQRLEAQLDGARAAVQQAEAAATRLGERSSGQEQLLREGAQAAEAVADLRSTREVAGHEVTARTAVVAELLRAREVAARQVVLQETVGERELAAGDAAVEAVTAQLAAVERQLHAWREVAQRRAAQLPPSSASPVELRELEQGLQAAEVAEREAQLAAHDVRVGRVVLRAGADGLVDRLFVANGQVLDEGAVVVSWFDPSRLWIEAMLSAELVARTVGPVATAGGDAVMRVAEAVPPGAAPAGETRGAERSPPAPWPVSVVLPDGAVLDAQIVEMGQVWRGAAAWMQAAVTAPEQRFLPVRVRADARRLPPNQRVRVVLPW